MTATTCEQQRDRWETCLNACRAILDDQLHRGVTQADALMLMHLEITEAAADCAGAA